MSCLQIDQIYLYLEKELQPSEMKGIEAHLDSCSKCKKAMEERKFILQAAESLPLWQTPPDFTYRTMSIIFPEKITLRSWLTTMATGFASTILILSAFFLISGENIIDLVVKLNSNTINSIRNFSILFVKLIKFISIFINIAVQFINFVFEGLNRLISFISPEIQIILVLLTLILSAFLVYSVSRILFIGERT